MTGPKRRERASNVRRYEFYRWIDSGLERNLGHRTIIPKDDNTVLIDEQQVPGNCILCAHVFFTRKFHLMNRHYRSKHHRNAIVVDNLKHLRCKCEEVRNRGLDKANRNGHYHCLHCQKPCDHRTQYGDHLIARHNFNFEDVQHLYD